MKSITALIFGLVAVSCGGGSSTPAEIPQADACNQASEAACAKVFSCKNDLILATVQAALGGTAEACQTYIKAGYCGKFACSAGQTYHGDKAKQCKDQFGTVMCSALSSAALTQSVASVLGTVPVCGEICTGGADAATGG